MFKFMIFFQVSHSSQATQITAWIKTFDGQLIIVVCAPKISEAEMQYKNYPWTLFSPLFYTAILGKN